MHKCRVSDACHAYFAKRTERPVACSYARGVDVVLDSHIQLWLDIVHDGHLEALQKGCWQFGIDPHRQIIHAGFDWRFDSLAALHRQFQQRPAVRLHPVGFQLLVPTDRRCFHDGDLLVADKRAWSVLGNDARPHCRLYKNDA